MKMDGRGWAIACLIAVAAGCAGSVAPLVVVVPSEPPVAVPDVQTATLAVIVQDARGRGIQGVTVDRADTVETDDGTTNADGYFAWAEPVPFGEYRVEARKAGYAAAGVSGRVEGNTDLRMVLAGLVTRRAGRVRANGRAVLDDGGEWNPLGASLFWGAWGYKFDRARLSENLEALKTAGVDYVRVLGTVGGESWADREADPRWPDYADVIAGFTDFAYDTYGIRTQWTIFGGSPWTETRGDRERVIDQFAAMAVGRESEVFAFEVANEAWQNGFGGDAGREDLRALGQRLNAQTDVLVALSAPAAGTECAVYAGSGADVATMHYDRDFIGQGAWRPVRQPWGYPEEYQGACNGQLPRDVFNNEPIGPESSVNADDDPVRIAAAYLTTFVAGNSAYVFHAGPGVRGGGEADRARGRTADFAALPRWDALEVALTAAKAILPDGMANWDRQNAQWATAPFLDLAQAVDEGAIVRAYAAIDGARVVAIVLGALRPVTTKPRQAMAIEVHRLTDGAIVDARVLAAGESFTLRGETAYFLKGTIR